jgi:O-antigen ligase
MKRPMASGHPHQEWGALLIRIGVVAGAWAVPLVMLPAGGNAFGPPKAMVLAWSSVCVLLGFVLEPARSAEILGAVRRTRVGLSAAVLVAVATVSTLFAPVLRTAVLGSYPGYRGLVLLLACGVIGLGGASVILRDRSLHTVTRSSSLCLALVALIAVGEQLGLPPAMLKLEGAVRAISTTGNASNLGVLVVILLPLAVKGALDDSRVVWRTVGGVATAGGALALVWTLSRGAWIAAIIAALIAVAFMVLARRGPAAKVSGGRSAARGRLAAAVVAAMLLATIMMPPVLSRARTLLDTGSPTAVWRLSTWESAVQMIWSRPLVGFGPDGFRLGYLAFKAPGQDDGRLGYLPAEAAHNLVLDSGVALGIPGLVAMLALGLAVVRVLVTPGSGKVGTGRERATIASGLVGGIVALQFHYVTMDTGPIMAVLIGVVLAWEADRSADATAAVRVAGSLRPGLLLTTVLFGIWAVVATGLFFADSSTGRALIRTEAGSPWEAERAGVAGAARLAPREPAIARAAGRAAGRALDAAPASQALDDGAASYTRAVTLSPGDPFILVEQAAFYMRAAGRLLDPDLLGPAEEAARNAESLDPSSGMPPASLGRIALMGGDAAGALQPLEKAVGLSPQNAAAWADLSRAYRLLGDEERAAAIDRDAARVLGDTP